MASALDERYLLGVNWSTKGQAEFITIPNALPPQKLPGSFLHETSLETKTAIFREYLPGQAAEIRKGQLLLEKLKKLAPSIADRYEVKEDLLDEFQLRLVNETPVDVKLQKEGDEVISYVALSYCWNEKYVDKMEGDYGEEIMVPFNTLIFRKIFYLFFLSTITLAIRYKLCYQKYGRVERSNCTSGQNFFSPYLGTLRKTINTIILNTL